MHQVFIYIASSQSVLVADFLRKRGYRVIVITAIPRFLTDLRIKGYNVQYLNCDTGVPRAVRGLLRQKAAITSVLLSKKKSDVLVLTHNAFDVLGWYLAKRWARKFGCKAVWFQEMDPKRSQLKFFEIKKPEKILLKYFYVFFLLGVSFIKILKSREPALGVIKNKALSKICLFDPIGNPKLIREVNNEETETIQHGVLFLGCYPEIGFFEKDRLERVISVLEETSNKLFFKPHPRSDEEVPSSRWTRLPGHEPVEYFIGTETVVVGIASTAMVFSSKNKGAITISLSKLLLGEGERHQYWMEFLRDECVLAEVLIPDSVEELQECLSVLEGWVR